MLETEYLNTNKDQLRCKLSFSMCCGTASCIELTLLNTNGKTLARIPDIEEIDIEGYLSIKEFCREFANRSRDPDGFRFSSGVTGYGIRGAFSSSYYDDASYDVVFLPDAPIGSAIFETFFLQSLIASPVVQEAAVEPATTDFPQVWKHLQFLLTHRTRERIFQPCLYELMADYLETRSGYDGKWSKRWLKFCFTFRTIKLMIQCAFSNVSEPMKHGAAVAWAELLKWIFTR